MKKLYKQFNELKIEEDIQEMPVSELEKARVKSAVMKQKKKSHLLRNLTAAAILFVGSSVTLSVAYPAIAAQLPIIGDVFAYFNDDKKPFDDYDKYASDIGTVKESNGIDITVTNAVYDGENITIAYLIESEQDLGERPMLEGNLIVEEYKDQYQPGTMMIEKINDNQYAGLYISYLRDLPALDSVNVSWNGDAVVKTEESHNPIVGEWTFNFTLDALESETTLFENLTTLDQGVEINVDKITTTPISTVFYLSYETDQSIKDAWENVLVADASVIDNLGNEYKVLPNTGWGDNPYKMNFRMTTSMIPEEVTSLYITPKFAVFNNIEEDLETFTLAPIEIPLQ